MDVCGCEIWTKTVADNRRITSVEKDVLTLSYRLLRRRDPPIDNEQTIESMEVTQATNEVIWKRQPR